MGLAEKLYGSGDKGVYEIALAEWNYQNNNCFQALAGDRNDPSDGTKSTIGTAGTNTTMIGIGSNGCSWTTTSIGRTTAGMIGQHKGNLRKGGI